MTQRTRNGKTPIFQVIYENIKRDIESGSYAPGAKLPSESQICREYGVQRDTARHAMELLVRDGLIYKRPGRGSFVLDERGRRPMTIEVEHLNDPIVAHLLCGGNTRLTSR